MTPTRGRVLIISDEELDPEAFDERNVTTTFEKLGFVISRLGGTKKWKAKVWLSNIPHCAFELLMLKETG